MDTQLTSEEMDDIRRYCKVDDDDTDKILELESTVQESVAYLDCICGVPVPPEGDAKRAVYMGVLKPMTLDALDNKDIQIAGHNLTENSAYKRRLNGLKLAVQYGG